MTAGAFDVYLVGSPYSGSTFLGNLLAANLDAAYVGETAHLPGFVDRYNLFAQPLGCLKCHGEHEVCPVWTNDLIKAAESGGPTGSMGVFRRAWGLPVVIDGSKWPAWLRLAMQDRPEEAPPVLVVIVVRSPLSFAVSATAATGAPTWEVVQWWRDIYLDTLRSANRLRLPTLVLRNEDVRRHPEAAVRAVAHVVGQPFSGTKTESAPPHSLGGNLWVHLGYSDQTWRLYESLGLPHQDQKRWSSADWTMAAQQGSVFEMARPKTESEALKVVQAVLDCPGLADLANSLGYELASEISTFVGRIVLPVDPTPC